MKLILGVGTKRDPLLGVSRHMIHISEELKKYNFDVKEVFLEKGIPSLPLTSYTLNSFLFDLFLLKYKNKFDFALFPSPTGSILKTKRTRVIVVLHEVLHKSFREMVHELKKKRLKLKWIKSRFPFLALDFNLLIKKEYHNLKAVDRVILANELHKDYIWRIYRVPKEKTFYIPNGVDTKFFSPSKGKLKDLEKIEEKKILFMGYFSWKKGAYYISKALQRLKRKDFKFIVAGFNSEYNLLKYFKKEFVKRNIINLGPISLWKQPKLYNACDFLILHSLSEATPMTMVEAMSCEKPVIGSNECDLNALKNGVTGLSVEKRNIKEIINAIEYLLDNEKEIRKMGAAARKLMIRDFDWEKIGKKIFESIETTKGNL